MIKPNKHSPLKTKLTPPEHRFVVEYVATGNQTESAQRAFPEMKRISCRQKGKNLMKTERVQTAIADRRAILEANANLGAMRIQQIIQEGKDGVALDASKFSIEQIDGRAKQTVDTNTNVTTLRIDLSGNLEGGENGNQERLN